MTEMTHNEARQAKKKEKVLAKYTSQLNAAREHFAEALKSLKEGGDAVLHEMMVSRPSGEKMNPEKFFYIIFCENTVCILEENQKILTLKGDSAWAKPYSEVAVREGVWRVNPVFRVLMSILTLGIYFFAVPSSWAMAQIAIAEKGKWTWFGYVPRHRFDADLDDYQKVADLVQHKGGTVITGDSRIKPFNGLGSTISTRIGG